MSWDKETGRIWWYKGQKEGHSFVRGPLTWEEILHRLENGTLTEETRVKRSSDVYWQGLSGLLYGKKRSYGPMIAVTACVVAILILLFLWAGNRKPGRLVAGPFGRASVVTGAPDSRDRRSLPQQPVAGGDVQQVVPQEPLTRGAIIKLCNDMRASHGLAHLAENQLLDKIAEDRVRDMFQKQYIGHVSPTGEQASDYAQRTGYHYKIIAENIAAGNFMNNQKVIDGWMQSPGHKQNMLSPDIKEIGVAIDKGQQQGANTWIAVQIFGLQSLPVPERTHCTAPPEGLLSEIESKKAELVNAENRLAGFKQMLEQESYAIEADRRNAGSSSQAVYNLNARISSYNERSAWYNNLVADVAAKRTILKTLAEDYNKRVQAYHECEGAGN